MVEIDVRETCCGRAIIIEKDFFIGNLLVRIYFIIVMIRWTGLAPWKFEFNFPGSLTSAFLVISAALSKLPFQSL